MKANPWLLPGVALLATGAWIATEKRSAANLEREITVLTERITKARGIEGHEAGAKKSAKTPTGKDGKIDWKDVAGKMAEMRGGGGMGDMRTMMRLQRLLLDMSAEELCTQLDEIASLDLDDMARKQIEGMIIGVLADKDPKLVIERFAGEITDENSGARWALQGALGKWAEKEPAAAAAWLDKQVADGKFESKSLDGKNPYRISFESIVVRQLLKDDPAAASARVSALPVDQREDLFQQGFSYGLASGSEASFAKLVRETMPADKAGGILANTARNLVQQGGYERVDGFIAAASATDDEKKHIVAQVMQAKAASHGNPEINVEDLDKARAWAATQSPGSVDSSTGNALGDALWRSGDFDKVSALVLQYNESGTDDEVLGAFLKSSGALNRTPEKAKALIEQIKDPALREEISALPQYKN